MFAKFSPEQLEFRDAMRRLMKGDCPPDVLRRVWAGESPTALWHAVAELGVLGISAPEEDGGLGLDLMDSVLLYEEAGAAALPGPVVETSAVGIPLLADAGERLWTERVACGDARLAVQIDGGMVLDADVADVMIAIHGGTAQLVTKDSMGSSPLDSVDAGRRLFSVEHSGGEELDLSAVAVYEARDRGVVGTAAQLIGLGRTLLDMSITYVGDRQQFGRAVGSFQAVQHALANVRVALDFAAPLVYRAAFALDRGDDDSPLHASMAKASASDAAVKASKVALQVHGAMGYSFEYDLHMFMKRAWALARSFGDAHKHRRRVGDLLGLPGSIH
jgi:alkylation response protein AidB-like acyl-CoA dehydrogenase